MRKAWLLLPFLLAGCVAPAAGGDGVATAGGATPSAGASTAATDDDGDGLKFAQCMRDHGLTWFKDPEPGQRGVRIAVPQGQDEAKVDAAMEACKKYLPDGGEPPKLNAEQLEQLRQLAKCMRANGVPDFPDPGPDGRITIERREGSGVDPDEEAFEKAHQACEKFRPARGGTTTS